MATNSVNPVATRDLLSLTQRVARDLPPSLARVAEFVLADPRVLATMSVTELAAANKVSKPSIVRFCQALGFSGLRPLKQAIMAEQIAAGMQSGAEARDHATPLAEEAPATALLGHLTEALVETGRRQNADILMSAARSITRAQLVAWYGIGDSGFLALSGHHRSQINGINSVASYMNEELLAIARRLTPGDVVVCISRSGRHAKVNDTMRNLKERYAVHTIAITGDPGSLLARQVDYPLISSPIDIYVGDQRTTMQSAQMMVLDALLGTVLQLRSSEVSMTGIAGGDRQAFGL